MSTVTGPLKDKFLQPIDRPEVMEECPDLVRVEKQKAEPVVEDKFAVIQIKSHQFKVTSDDKIYLERVNEVDVNDHIFLKKVLVWASKDETVVGRPYIKEAYVHALVEVTLLGQCHTSSIYS